MYIEKVLDIVQLMKNRGRNKSFAFIILFSVYQGSSNIFLEGRSAAEFSSNSDQTHLPVIL